MEVSVDTVQTGDVQSQEEMLKRLVPELLNGPPTFVERGPGDDKVLTASVGSAGLLQVSRHAKQEVSVKVLVCNAAVAEDPEESWYLVEDVRKALGAGPMKWSAKTVPEHKDNLLKLYFTMLGDKSDPKELVAQFNSTFSEAAIWRIRDHTRLVLNNAVMSDTSDEHMYHELLVHPALLAATDPQKVLIIGGGEGATLREVLKDSRVENVTMVEIDEQLVQLCHIHLPEMHG